MANRLLRRRPAPEILGELLVWVRRALDWDVSNAFLWTRLADCLRALGDNKAAEDVLWETLRRFPDDEVCRNILAELLRERGGTEEAEALLRETKERFPDDEVCRNILAELLREHGGTEEAEALLRETKECFPDDEVCRTILAELLREGGKTEEAEILLHETMKRFPDNAVCRTILAELLREGGKTEEAEILLRETMKRFPDNAVCRTILAKLLCERGETEDVAALLRETETVHDSPNDHGMLLAPQYSIGSMETEAFDDFPPENQAVDTERLGDPLIPWAAERAPIIRLALGMTQTAAAHRQLLDAAQTGGAAELAEVALRLLFPEDTLPLEDALRARPDSLALRLLQAGQNAERGRLIFRDAPETENVLWALYRTEADPEAWPSRFRAAVMACADLSSPPAWVTSLA